MKRLTIGLAAHVDAGKTTLSEALLYTAGAIRRLGRVDSRDAFLDTDAVEKERGITIFSKQAVLQTGDAELTLIDTPGHVDFSAETERVLGILDACVLVISAADGVQAHTRTLAGLLEAYHVPVIVFVNKMDQPGADREALMRNLQSQFSEACVDFSPEAEDARAEALAMCSEELMEEFLADGQVKRDTLQKAVMARQVFPCFFGSALKLSGIEELLEAIPQLLSEPAYPETFAARVFKILRDDQKNRVTFVKILGGRLSVRDTEPRSGEKISQIRVYSGEKYDPVTEAFAGQVVGVTGLSATRCGQGLGEAEDERLPLWEPVLRYDCVPADGGDAATLLTCLRELEEEEPALGVSWNEETSQIRVKLSGPVQAEILTRRLQDRFGRAASFVNGSIEYRETIAAPVEGVGHFEPLRHYAEVHLLIEPGPRGSGITLATALPTERLSLNWQRLIFTHLLEKTHAGVLTGAPLTDVKFTLVAGRAHQKHTEGGDFRQATYRAVRQGLMQAQSVLLEPWYDFTLSIPDDQIGRAMHDLDMRHAAFNPPQTEGGVAVITGAGPVATLQNYQQEVNRYTHGKGSFAGTPAGYRPAHNPEEVIAASGYVPELDAANPCGSVFCTHGAGFYVDWYEVPQYMHLDSGLGLLAAPGGYDDEAPPEEAERRYRQGEADDAELMDIFERTYGKVERRIGDWDAAMRLDYNQKKEKPYVYKPAKRREEVLLVDGYNVIFAWKELADQAAVNIDAARDRLADVLKDYQGATGMTVILVFDAYRVAGHTVEVIASDNIFIVYTAEAQTADAYIEMTVREIAKRARATVVTSDGLEQVIIRGAGCGLISSREFAEVVEKTKRRVREEAEAKSLDNAPAPRLFDAASPELAKHLDDVRRGITAFGEKPEENDG